MGRLFKLLAMTLVLAALVCCVLVSCDKDDVTTPAVTDGSDTSEGGTVQTTVGASETTSEDTSAGGTTAPVERVEPNSITEGKVRVQLLSDGLVRIEAAMSDGSFQDKPSFSVINRDDWYNVEYSVESLDGEKLIKTEKYTVHLPENASSVSSIYITDAHGNEIWNFAGKTDSNVYLPSASDELDSWYFCDNPRVIPSENGYSIPEEGYEDNNGWVTDRLATDIFVFLPEGSYENFMKNFIELTGRSEMITLDLFGYWDSRWYQYTSATALRQIKEYQSRGYSIDLLVIDTDWRDASSGIGYTINERLFPDMADFLEQAHELGVSIYFNDHPEPAQGTDSLLDEDEIEYRSENLKLILSLGLDYWWYDRNWSVALNDVDPGISIYASGMYAFQWITEEYYESIVDDIDEYARRALIMANVDGILNGELEYAPEIAAHKYSIQWTGDIGTLSEDLADEIYNLIYGGVELGLPYVSSDLGGHTSEVTDDMYVRWLQFGALSTICRVHCTKPYSRMPWLYGETAESVVKEYVGMRYRLLPLFYQLAHENYETGLPIMRRLDINYSQYAEASRNDQYLLGDYILVAPMDGDFEMSFENATLTSGGNTGLYAEYFNNSTLTGTPAYTAYETEINYDWKDKGPEVIGSPSENFSIRWTGTMTIGDNDAYLSVYADDGIRVWVDGELVINGWTVYDTVIESDVFKAGSTHDIKIEYCEYTGQAHVRVGLCETMDQTRTVFIPEGSWIDVWTGETYVGPATYTVSHPLETSPIFVRNGALIPLVKQMSNTKEDDWSEMTIDVYPSVDYEAQTVIYEDDTRTVAYKDGKYRTTLVEMKYDSDHLGITINPCQGSFDGDLAFTERKFTIRIHARADFGKITKIVLNGKEITDYEEFKKSADASPFMQTGASCDSDIVEFSFTTDIYKLNEIEIYFASTVEDGKNDEYNDASADFTVNVEEITKRGMASGLNISEEGTIDWALFGYSDYDDVVRKALGKGLIGSISSDDDNFGFQDNYRIYWSDGDVKTSGSSTNGPVSNRNFKITLKTEGDKAVYTIYLGGYQSLAKISIRDRSGHVETYTFGNMSTNFYRKITIECSSDEASELFINYSLLCGNNITFSAVTVSDADD